MHPNRLRQYADLQDELLTRKAAGSLRAFVEQAWPVLEPTTPFLPNWHIDLVCEHLEAITAGQTTRLLINLPPRYMKSLLVSVFWPVWEWISSPSRRWICVSYSDALSLKLSLDRRTLVQSEWYQARWGHTVQLSSDQNVKGEFRNTRQGVMVATSVGGSVTGKGGDRIIVDDLHNPQQADSDAQREAALRFFRETLSTRLAPPPRATRHRVRARGPTRGRGAGAAGAGHRPSVRCGSRPGHTGRAGPRSWHTRRRGGPTRPNTRPRRPAPRVPGTASLPDRDKSGRPTTSSVFQSKRPHAVAGSDRRVRVY